MPPHRMPPFVANDLSPATIREARREISHGGWRSAVTGMVVATEFVVATMIAMVALPFVPFVVVPVVLFEDWQLLVMATGGAVLAMAVLAIAVLGLVWAEWTRRAWNTRRLELVEQVAPYNQAVADPRWLDTQALLFELRGPDPASEQAQGVYRLTLALSDAFVRRDRIAAAVRSASAIGEDGVDALATLLAQHDDALGRTLVDLKQTCAVALRQTYDVTGATEHLLRDLNLRLAAGAEIGAGSADFGAESADGRAPGPRDPRAERMRAAARRTFEP